MSPRDVSYEDAMAKMYAENPDNALEMIDSYLEDGEADETFVFLIQVAKAFGWTAEVTEQTGLKQRDLRWPLPGGAALPPLEKSRSLLRAVRSQLVEKRVSAA